MFSYSDDKNESRRMAHEKRWPSMNSCELTTAISALANSIACQMTTDEVALAGAIFSQLGDTLVTIAAQRSLCEGTK